MNANSKKVLACVDGFASTFLVADWAIWSAQSLRAPLEFLHVVDRHLAQSGSHDLSGSLGVDAQDALMQELATLDEQRTKVATEHGRRLLDHAKARAATAGLSLVEARQRHGTLVDTLLDMEPEIRLAILGPHTHNRNASRLSFDHHVESVVRSLRVPVLVANRPHETPRSFLLAFDGSRTGQKMVQTVAASALLQGLDCHIVTVGESTAQASAQADAARATLSAAGFACTVVIVEGHAEEVLQAYLTQHRIDLLVMGAYGHSRIRELILGSITTTMLLTSTVPVLILR